MIPSPPDISETCSDKPESFKIKPLAFEQHDGKYMVALLEIIVQHDSKYMVALLETFEQHDSKYMVALLEISEQHDSKYICTLGNI